MGGGTKEGRDLLFFLSVSPHKIYLLIVKIKALLIIHVVINTLNLFDKQKTLTYPHCMFFFNALECLTIYLKTNN